MVFCSVWLTFRRKTLATINLTVSSADIVNIVTTPPPLQPSVAAPAPQFTPFSLEAVSASLSGGQHVFEPYNFTRRIYDHAQATNFLATPKDLAEVFPPPVADAPSVILQPVPVENLLKANRNAPKQRAKPDAVRRGDALEDDHTAILLALDHLCQGKPNTYYAKTREIVKVFKDNMPDFKIDCLTHSLVRLQKMNRVKGMVVSVGQFRRQHAWRVIDSE
jgi:hypothetical protein